MTQTDYDPKGLIREAYRIDGITLGECRSIFLDWALTLPAGTDTETAIKTVLAKFADGQDGHPMTSVLTEGLAQAPQPKRRGGRKGRVSPT